MLTVYKASAGSGKTFTLALDYIRSLLGSRDEEGRWHLARKGVAAHRAILAVTFTNKATNEMKTRIIHELAVLAGREKGWEKASPYRDTLLADFGCSPEQLADHASEALSAILQDYGNFNVSTIDAFFQRVLRTFAREAGVMGNYEVDLDKRAAYDDAVDELLSIISRDEEAADPATRRLEKWVLAFMEHAVSEGNAFNIMQRNSQIRSEMVAFLEGLTDEDFKIRSEAFGEYLDDTSRLEGFQAGVAAEARRLRRESLPALLDDIRRLVEALGKRAKKACFKWLDKSADDFVKSPGTAFGKVVEEGPVYFISGYDKTPLTTDEEAIADEIGDKAAQLEGDMARAAVLDDMVRGLFRLGLLSAVTAVMRRRNAESSTLLLDDTNALLRRIIGDEDTPFVYERMGLWLRHFLIDEFQDTSALQWANLRPLVAESLATDNANLIIGDEKQCIYRWRGSRPELLGDVHADFPGRTRLEGADAGANTNWRSTPEVVRFNNTLFSFLNRNAEGDLEGVYANVVQRIAPGNLGRRGHVTVRALSDDDDPRRLAADEVCRLLRAGYRFADIAVLYRTRAEGADFISYLFAVAPERPELQGLRVVSEDSMRLDASPAVNMVVNLLRFLVSADPGGPEAPGGSTGRRDLIGIIHRFEYAVASGRSCLEALDAAVDPSKADAIPDPVALASGLRCMTLAAVVEQFIATYVPAETRSRENLYISAFEDCVLDFAARPGGGDFGAFLDWWDSGGHATSVGVGADSDALTVMTIHKSKGLEFRCVIVPEAARRLREDDHVWMEPRDLDFLDPSLVPPLVRVRPVKDMLKTGYADQYRAYLAVRDMDIMNVLYVAFTRAKDELTVFYNAGARASDTAKLLDDAVHACADPEAVESLRARAAADGFDADPFAVLQPLFPEKQEGEDAGEEAVGDEDEDSPVGWGLGEPTAPGEERRSQRPVFEPVAGDPVPDSRAALRSDLWRFTVLDTETRD